MFSALHCAYCRLDKQAPVARCLLRMVRFVAHRSSSFAVYCPAQPIPAAAVGNKQSVWLIVKEGDFSKE
jgi:hypothetical protein